MIERYDDDLKDIVIEVLLEQRRGAYALAAEQSLRGEAERKLIRVYEENTSLRKSVETWKAIAEDGLGVDLIAVATAAQNGPTPVPDPEPQPSDGPDFPAEHVAWLERNPSGQ